MCGLIGFTGGGADNAALVKKMADKIVHRGPDSFGSYTDENITLGFRRLSIIDLSEGDQPIFNEDKSLVVVMNGELYNYKSIREELIAKGHVFGTNSDTECLVHLYEEYGTDMLSRLRGMFAFIIYDKKDNSVFCARDFFGIKPVYYSFTGGNLYIASEIKALLEHDAIKKELNEDALENYLTFQYSVLEETFFKGIFKLMPAHYMIFKDGSLVKKRYWHAEFDPQNSTLEDATDAIEHALLDSVEAHKVADVEVGSFLSSGVDSSFVAATFKGDKTFTVGFDYDNYNEIGYAKAHSEAVGIQNYSKTITTEEYWDAIPHVQYHMDEPLADASCVALYFVSKEASKHVKVVLSGEGADELFGGYNIYREPLDIKLLTDLPMPIRRFLGAAAKRIPFSFKGKNLLIRASKTIEERFIGNANVFSVEDRTDILKNSKKTSPMQITGTYYEKVKHKDDITKMQYLDVHLWMVGDILLKADKMSMAHSLEVRVPFLDKEVFKVASKLRTDFRTNRNMTKYAFRLTAKKFMPDDVAQKKKLGFPVPIRIWLKEDKYYDKVKEKFTSKAADRYFNTDKLVGLLEVHRSGKKDLSRKIWAVYIFLVWYDRYFEA